MTPAEYCKDKAAKSGSSFYLAMRLLPKAKQEAMLALYAFCREVDDVVDEIADEKVASMKLSWWRTELAEAVSGNPQHPVTKALMMAVKNYSLPPSELFEIIDGMEMDLHQARYNRFEDLLIYCHRVAGVVGTLSARIFGYKNDATLKYAHELGIAFQLTNIIRDVGEDARRGRLYLPVEELQKFDVPAAELLRYQESDRFEQLMQYQIERARKYYDLALAQLPKEDASSQKTGLIMAAIYRATLEEIVLDGPSKVLNQHLSLPAGRKIYLALKTWVFGYSK
ncbi:presqualene diphosphate synthase HpnD [Leeia sp. TBRC 13508]|uniref:Presqualene diphosphate synthase HpnD n=1 Tax=Leeia speluncae TaxID=2884804 RepID=A0ABS8DAN0_9NEIS|nr:presqualene diphosphate synthase HpnD [Leeia speluncae]MCB6185266.1 presqualene diphosphate synthase HpnD [Leeia speluncae]